MAAERSKRAKILESEGIKESEINVAMGQKHARILLSEAKKVENINSAVGDSEATVLIASGQSKAIDLISDSLKKEQGQSSASLSIAREFVSAFAALAKHSNTLILPSDPSNIANMVSQAMAIFHKLSSDTHSTTNSNLPELQRPPNILSDSKLNESDVTVNVNKKDSSIEETSKMSVFNSATRVEESE